MKSTFEEASLLEQLGWVLEHEGGWSDHPRDPGGATMFQSSPSRMAGRYLSVRDWECMACGTHHDRDVNSAINTLITGAGTAHEVRRCVA